MEIVKTISDHPYIVGGGVFALGLLWIMSRSGGGDSQATDAGLASAYYGAITADKVANTQERMAQTQANAAITINQQNTDAYTHVQDLWSDNSIRQAEIDSDTSKFLAPFALTGQYIDALRGIASLPGSTETVQSGNSGFFGLFGSSKTTQVYKPNPNAAGAASSLYQIGNGFMGFLPGH